ncbi:glycosyltransferase family 2 protein [Algoriphagus mannitolivorans]|uniref:glycosyltransferase family 2 protein n=1 Tax=Algoriphagus mannitolivorans TaxID=226504 RepID=UPI000A01EF8A|nr:glycosyltransferase family 2 protein [Algoriphagus mannitolivorans]
MINNKISVITINLNNLEGLKKTVESVLNQDYPNLEYLVIDGESKDGSQEYLQAQVSGIDYLLCEKDSGVYEAMNKGIKNATGDYLIFLNSGDFFESSKSLSKLIQQSNGENLVFGDIEVVESEGSYVKKYPDGLSFRYFYYDSLPHPACLISKSLFDEIGMYDTEMKIASDWKFFMLAVIKGGCSYRHVPEVISVFDAQGMSSSPSNSDALERERRHTLKRYFNINYKFYSIYLKVLRKSFYKKI